MTPTLTMLVFLAAAVVGFVHGGCNEKLAMKRNEVRYITSPDYPGNFTEYVDCYYELYTTSSEPGLLVYVDVLDVTLRCDDDKTQLRVYDGFSRRPRNLGKICRGGQTTFRSPKQTLYLTFRSRTDHANRSRGFRLRVRTEPKYTHCFTQETAVHDVTSTPALLTSPFYPYGTAANVNCRWLLKSPRDSRVNVTILDADMKGSSDCHNFGLSVYDGKTTYDDALLVSVCDNSRLSFQSSGPYLLLVFKSGPMVYRSGGGIQLSYVRIPNTKGEQQLIGETLFYIITALLIVLIVIVSLLAAFKLFIVPHRRKKTERQRRVSRARLTSVSSSRTSDSSLSNSQSDSPSQTGRHHHHHHHHTSCSRALSSASVTSGASVWSGISGISVARLLSLSTLKKFRQDHRHSGSSGSSRAGGGCGGGDGRLDRRGAADPSGSTCVVYNATQSRGVLIRVPDYVECDLPPSYEEAVMQVVVVAAETVVVDMALAEASGQGVSEEAPGQDVSGQASGQGVSEEAPGQDVSGQASRQGVSEEAPGQDVSGQASRQGVSEEASGQDVPREASRQGVSEEALGQDVPREASGQGVSEEASGQGMSEEASGQDVSEEASGQDVSRNASG